MIRPRFHRGCWEAAWCWPSLVGVSLFIALRKNRVAFKPAPFLGAERMFIEAVTLPTS